MSDYSVENRAIWESYDLDATARVLTELAKDDGVVRFGLNYVLKLLEKKKHALKLARFNFPHP